MKLASMTIEQVKELQAKIAQEMANREVMEALEAEQEAGRVKAIWNRIKSAYLTQDVEAVREALTELNAKKSRESRSRGVTINGIEYKSFVAYAEEAGLPKSCGSTDKNGWRYHAQQIRKYLEDNKVAYSEK